MKTIFNKIIAPSLLSADFCDVRGAVKDVEESGADWLHLDVMDGKFVPNITFGSKMVGDIRKITKLPLDVHLMIENPETKIDGFAKAGADYITIHQEGNVHIDRFIHRIKELGVKAGISIVPSTPVSILKELLPIVDLVLIMSVNPGFGGQKMIPSCLSKVEELVDLRKKNQFSYLLSVDGGVNRNTVQSVRDSGADVLISGSAFFGAEDKKSEINFFRGHKTV